MSLPEPNFINRDPNVIEQEWIAYYEDQSDKTLQPAQPERLLCATGAYRETNTKIKIQEVAMSLLVRFAPEPILIYLGELVGKYMLQAQKAKSTVRYQLSEIQDFDINISIGNIVESKDGKVLFSVLEDSTIVAGQLYVDIEVECETEGEIGNGYLPGQICVMSDPIPYVESVTNITASSGGADKESLDSFRERIMLAPEEESYGGREAYKAWTRSVHQDIIDVAVVTPNEPILILYKIDGISYNATINPDNTVTASHIVSGTINRPEGKLDIVFDNGVEFHCTIPRGGKVQVHPLTADGNPSAELKNAIIEYLNDDEVVPLGDVIEVLDPLSADFQILANITAKQNVDKAALKTTIETVLAAYTTKLKTGFKKSAIRAEIISVIFGTAGVDNVDLPTPSADINPAENEWANCTAITVNVS